MGKSLDTLQQFLAAWQDGWEDACRQYIHPEMEIIEPPELPQGGVHRGWDAPVKVSNIYHSIWDMSVREHTFYEDEATGVVTSRYLTVWKSKETGKSLEQPVVELNHISDGKITKMEVFMFDAGGLLATLEP